MPKTKTKTQTPVEDGRSKPVDFPNVQPASRMQRNMPHPPTTLRVCGNTIPVRDGKAGEADPKKLKRRRQELLKKRSERDGKHYDIDETRI